MESGARPELNAQRYAAECHCRARPGNLSKGRTITGIIILGRFALKYCKPGNFGTRLSYERISQLLGTAQSRFPGRKQ